MKKTFLSLLILVILFTNSHANTKIAVVDPVEIFNNSNLGSVSLKKLENDLKPQANTLEQQQNDILKKMQALKDSSTTMTKADLNNKQKQIQQQQQTFTKKVKILQQQSYIARDKLSKRFQSSFNRSVATIAKQKGYNIVLTKQALAYVDGVDDISNDVIAMMNSSG